MDALLEAEIIPAGPNDAGALARVHVTSWRAAYEGILPAAALARMSPRRHANRFRAQLLHPARGEICLAAETPDGLIGYAMGEARENNGWAEVFTLYLLPALQGRGVGRRLLQSSARALRGQGARSLVIWALSANRRAGGFYRHCGGTPSESRPVRGWSADLWETAYRWADITRAFDD
jgi:GNAT superfamily N-acetyltransferase